MNLIQFLEKISTEISETDANVLESEIRDYISKNPIPFDVIPKDKTTFSVQFNPAKYFEDILPKIIESSTIHSKLIQFV